MGTDARHERPVGNPAAGVVHRLSLRHETLATIESLTGGLLSASIVEIAGVSGVYRGGLVVYATELKSELAGVPADLLAERGPVDPDVAVALAEGGRRRCGADWGLATTGVAGPEPQDGKPVGLVYVAVAGPGGSRVRQLDLDGGRDHIRSAAVIEGLRLLAEQIQAAAPDDTAAGDAAPLDAGPVDADPVDADPAGTGRR
ncbi:nicotinamide-nucleotide amidase [Micromonospora viridifaciens]|uniref:Nicotinamide-nucleotide amidase n=1 Tax=Micromonospora viridifaciens TaxID=1881 RepID=A0A1C4ZEI4_MICVI|nr:CinA family protein [Micromonospora viridifaciens]SCF31325.1 nicotinamide-nucleotide amidase [Micromonospora viridifaciens]